MLIFTYLFRLFLAGDAINMPKERKGTMELWGGFLVFSLFQNGSYFSILKILPISAYQICNS
jgi:hypothetical protein